MYNVHRGEDATGLWTPKNGVIKSLDRASKFLNSDKFKNIERSSVGFTPEDDNLDQIEQEANLVGTMTFRNWTDSINEKKIKIHLV